MNDVKRTTQISSDIGRGCEHCDHWIGATQGDVSDSINHYIATHGYRLLHVGTETNHGPDGKAWHHTVAILGHDHPPAIRKHEAVVMQIPDDMQSPRGGSSPSSTGKL